MVSTIDKSILKKLHSFVVIGETREANFIIEALKEMLVVAPELKLEDKLLKLFDIEHLTSPLTIA